MSGNKFMHPRNIYKTPPDFSQLAVQYPEFLEITKLDVGGKVHIDFKDPHSLRVLTKCLLNFDFALNVHIPEDKLVPTLPLRLNYILWIEDLLQGFQTAEHITGIDIGTGACAVYPLLGAVKNKWRMLGTETDETSFRVAINNVKNNNLENFITLKLNTSPSLLDHCFVDNTELKYDFCMCNPPFYSSLQDLCESRSDARPPPKNAFTGSLSELVTEGGEVEFVTKLINESVRLKDNIKIFTTMVGHKASLKHLMILLGERCIQFTHTEFCQGRTTRWGLAWTYLHTCDLQTVAPPITECRKKNTSMAFVIPPLAGSKYNSESVYKKVKELLTQLSITYKLFKKKGSRISLEIKSYTNTWSNQRRKRRQMKRLEIEAKRRKVSENNQATETVEIYENETDYNKQGVTCEKYETLENCNIDCKKLGETCKMNGTLENSNTDCKKQGVTCKIEETRTVEIVENNNIDCKKQEITLGSNKITEKNNSAMNEAIPTTSKDLSNTSIESKEIILHAILTIGKVENNVILDMEYLSGSAGKDGMHQVVQYIKNNWK